MFTNESPIFIVGVPRSGTTLLRLLLNSHSEVSICGEIHFFDQILKIGGQLQELNKDNIDTLLNKLENSYNLKRLANFRKIFNNVKKKLAESDKISFELLYLHILKECANLSGKKIIGEKTPQNIRYINDIKRIFPNSRFIHIIRDPRACVNSLLKVDWTTDDIIVNAIKWKIDILYSQDLTSSGVNSMEIFYEDLVSEPKNTLVRICNFIGVDFEDNMLNFHRNAKYYIGDNQPEKINTFQPISTGQINKWQIQLSEEQIYLIEKISGSLLRKLGYNGHKISIKSKLYSPFVLLKELKKYYDYKKQDSQFRKNETPEIIYSDNSTLKKMVFKALIYR